MSVRRSIAVLYWNICRSITPVYEQSWLLIRFWPREIYHRLRPSEDEFHRSLDLDSEAMMYMTDRQTDRYLKSIAKRRMRAHEESL